MDLKSKKPLINIGSAGKASLDPLQVSRGRLNYTLPEQFVKHFAALSLKFAPKDWILREFCSITAYLKHSRFL